MNTPSPHLRAHRAALRQSASQRPFRILSLLGPGSLILAGFLATGCATQYRFQVEAINQRQDAGQRFSYHLVDARPDPGQDRRVFDSIRRDVETALSSRGYYPAPIGATPDMEIELDFGISAPVVKQHFVSKPVYSLPSNLNGPSARGSTQPMRASLVPEFKGMTQVPEIVTTYRKFLRLTAREPRVDGPTISIGRQIWSVYVTNEDGSQDLPTYAHLMVAAAMDNVGRDYKGEQQVAFTKRDQRVAFVERGSGLSEETSS